MSDAVVGASGTPESAHDAALNRPAQRAFFQSSRADYSLAWTETGLTVVPPPEAVGDWPSDRWRAHLATCGLAYQCRHRVPEPMWWVLMGGRGVPLHPDAGEARDAANLIINGFRGHPVLPPELLVFVQDAVRDALCVAPQPVSKAWIKSTMSALGMLMRWVSHSGGELTREHVFADRTVNRFLYVALRDYDPATVRIYRTRIELVALAVRGVVVRDRHELPVIPDALPEEPVTPHQEADLYLWATSLRPETRRRRLAAVVAIGLGVGARAPELLRANRDDALIDERGVHVRLINNAGEARWVTCRWEWEERLANLIESTPAGHTLVTPWRTKPVTKVNHHDAMVEAQDWFTPPVFFNITTLRNTWFVRQIEAGVPHHTLRACADLRSESTTSRLLPYCREQSIDEAAAAMRGMPR